MSNLWISVVVSETSVRSPDQMAGIQRWVATYSASSDAYTVSPVLITVSESTGCRPLETSIVSTVSISNPKNAFGRRVARQAEGARRLSELRPAFLETADGSDAAARRRRTRAAPATGTAAAMTRGVVESKTRAVDF